RLRTSYLADHKETCFHAPARIYDYQRIPLRPPIRATLGDVACAALPNDAADLYHHRNRHGGGAEPGGCVRRPGLRYAAGRRRVDLLFVPLLFLLSFGIAIQRYNSALRPVASAMNQRFGVMNAGLAETIGGMDVVKGFAQEPHEERRFGDAARAYRDTFVRSG